MKSKKKNCDFEGMCDCNNKAKSKRCDICTWYSMIDSGYGYCRALPQPIVVAWCKDICSYFSFLVRSGKE